jgi:hypothetical protein
LILFSSFLGLLSVVEKSEGIRITRRHREFASLNFTPGSPQGERATGNRDIAVGPSGGVDPRSSDDPISPPPPFLGFSTYSVCRFAPIWGGGETNYKSLGFNHPYSYPLKNEVIF